jgi:hypothetical protein
MINHRSKVAYMVVQSQAANERKVRRYGKPYFLPILFANQRLQVTYIQGVRAICRLSSRICIFQPTVAFLLQSVHMMQPLLPFAQSLCVGGALFVETLFLFLFLSRPCLNLKLVTNHLWVFRGVAAVLCLLACTLLILFATTKPTLASEFAKLLVLSISTTVSCCLDVSKVVMVSMIH